MRIHPLNLENQHDIQQFIDLPAELYQGCSQWVPSLHSEMQLVIDRSKHPFYQHSEAEFFIAESEGQILGRVAVLHHRPFSEYHKQATAFFYYFESINDPEVSAGLFNAALDWCRARQVKNLLGPKGFSRSSGLGILTEGFEYSPAVGIPYNHSYYPALLEQFGFKKETDHLSGYLNKNQHFPESIYTISNKVQQRSNFWVKTFRNKAEMRRWIPAVEIVHQEAFQHNPGFYPSSPEDFKLLANGMIQIADPKLIKLIMYGENVAGFIIAYADISNALRKSHGRIWPLGWLWLLQDLKQSRLVNLNGVGLLPEYQGMGGNALLYTELEKTLREFNFEQAEIIQVDERNFKSKADMERLGVHWSKRHRTYRLDLD
jgi:GNAT superfamily N-acetyltransferase